MGEALNMSSSATQYNSDAITARADGRVQRNQAYAQAYKLETDATAASHIAGDNMMTMRRNQTLQTAAARAAAGASGFGASSGSKLTVEQSTAEIFEKAIADAAKSNTIAEQNARYQANALRRHGDTTLNLANIQADYMNRLASINRKTAPWALVGSGFTLGSQLINQYNITDNPTRT